MWVHSIDENPVHDVHGYTVFTELPAHDAFIYSSLIQDWQDLSVNPRSCPRDHTLGCAHTLPVLQPATTDCKTTTRLELPYM